MGERTVVRDIVTKEMLIKAFRSMGVSTNAVIEVHASLSSFGFVIGGARTVVDALLETVGEGGTIMMPVQTTDNSEPSRWQAPPAMPELWKEIRREVPAYEPETSDLREMGAVAGNFCHRPGIVFSSHPALSYAALGRYAKLLCNRQSLHFPLGEESPAARLYELKGNVLLLGVGFDKCTCMHLAEYRAEARPIEVDGASTRTAGDGREWKKYLNLELKAEDFENVRAAMIKKSMIRTATLSGCEMQYFPAAGAIDEAVRYFQKTAIYDLYR